jgi:hypothetical protein
MEGFLIAILIVTLTPAVVIFLNPPLILQFRDFIDRLKLLDRHKGTEAQSPFAPLPLIFNPHLSFRRKCERFLIEREKNTQSSIFLKIFTLRKSYVIGVK